MPQGAGVERGVDFALDMRIGDLDEASGVARVVPDEPVSERENVNNPYRSPVATAGSAGASTTGARAVGPRLDVGAPFDERLERPAVVG